MNRSLSPTILGSGLEEIATSGLDGILYRSDIFETNPRYCGIVNNSLAELNDLPLSLGHLPDEFRNDLNHPKTIAKLVEIHPALAGKILKLVNTSFPGLRRRISNLKRGTTLLGIHQLRALVNGNGSFQRKSENKLPSSLPLSRLYQHSVAVGKLAGAIADTLGNLDGATLVSAGLLHDAGMLVLASINPEKFADCLDECGSGRGDLLDIELSTMGLTHPLLSAALGDMWNLPERLWKLLLYQDHPGLSGNPRMVAVLQLAQFMAREDEIGTDGQRADTAILNNAARILGISPELATRLVDNLTMDDIIRDCHLLSSLE